MYAVGGGCYSAISPGGPEKTHPQTKSLSAVDPGNFVKGSRPNPCLSRSATLHLANSPIGAGFKLAEPLAHLHSKIVSSFNKKIGAPEKTERGKRPLNSPPRSTPCQAHDQQGAPRGFLPRL